MKKTDLATIVMVALLSMGTAYLVTTALVGQAVSGSVKVKTVDPIVSDVTHPDTTVFNKDAINPTVEVIVGNK